MSMKLSVSISMRTSGMGAQGGNSFWFSFAVHWKLSCIIACTYYLILSDQTCLQTRHVRGVCCASAACTNLSATPTWPSSVPHHAPQGRQTCHSPQTKRCTTSVQTRTATCTAEKLPRLQRCRVVVGCPQGLHRGRRCLLQPSRHRCCGLH